MSHFFVRTVVIIYVFPNDEGGTAFGGLNSNGKAPIGMFWTPSSRLHPRKGPSYAIVAHELGHTFQKFVHADGGGGFKDGPNAGFGEMTSQWMLWQKYSEWFSFARNHLNKFINNSYLAFMSWKLRYEVNPFMEWWSEKQGVDFIGKMWRQQQNTEDPVQVYKRLTGINQQQFNNLMFQAAIHSITWDMDRINKVSKPYRNLFSTDLHAVSNGWEQIDKSNCPENYGYNGIQLQVPSAGTKIGLKFKGLPNASGYRHVKTGRAGWRYGFLAYKSDGSRTYSEIHSSEDGQVRFKMPDNTSKLWLVAMGAPSQHFVHQVDKNASDDEQWPYKIKLSGTGLLN